MSKVFLVVIIGLIYFFVLKPNQIREQCTEQARQEAVIKITEDIIENERERQQFQEDYEALAYLECLDENGLSE